jgi:alkaline phosphatase D
VRRRDLLVGAAAFAACAPAIRRSRPAITHGLQVGDVATGRASLWARCDRVAPLYVEWDTTERFTSPRRVVGSTAAPDRDHSVIAELEGLPDGQTIVVRARFGDGSWEQARFRTPKAQGFRFAWSGDTCGQGYGRNPEWGGMRGYAAIRATEPAFFLHSGDLIYADNPIEAEKRTLAGRLWKNITNERVARVAQELDDFRARFQYNLEDEHVRALASEVSILAQWDDHETHNNWWPGEQLDDHRYDKVRDASTLAGWAMRALREWTPVRGPSIQRVISYGPLLDVIVVDLRSWRTPNDANRGDTGAMLGSAQAAWLVQQLGASRARWRVIACDQPLSLVIPDGKDNDRQEGFANGDPGPPLGREKELAGVLAALPKNTIFVTADVHYAAAHYYAGAPRPFWEFVGGPIHAGTFGPNELDATFGPELKFQWAPPPGTGDLAPWDGLQSFGTVDVAADALTVGLWGIDGKRRYDVTIPYESP